MKDKNSRTHSHIFMSLLLTSTIVVLICLSFYVLYSPPRQPVDLVVVRGNVVSIVNKTMKAVDDVTVIVCVGVEYAVKGFSNESGFFEVWIDYPENISIPVRVFAFRLEGSLITEKFNGSYVFPKREDLELLEETASYTLWGYINCETIIMEKTGEENEIVETNPMCSSVGLV